MRRLAKVVITALVSVLILWTPFWLRVESFWGIDFEGQSMLSVAQNYDAMNFLVVARSWYDPTTIQAEYSELVGERGTRYFAAHYPVYAGMIWLFDLVVSGPEAIYLSILVSNGLLAMGLLYFFGYFRPQSALLLTIVALFLPPRMLPLRAIGSNELVCLFFVLTSIVSYCQQKRWQSAALGALAVLTRSPAILLFGAYLLASLSAPRLSWRERLGRVTPYLLMPAALLGLWAYYGGVYGDPLAYFKVGGNLNLYFPPFLSLASELPWVAGGWREDMVYHYLWMFGGSIWLFKLYPLNSKQRIIPIFALLYTVAVFFVAHRDIGRYGILVSPLIVLGLTEVIEHLRRYKILLLLLLPIFLYAWNFMLNNIQPIANWAPFL